MLRGRGAEIAAIAALLAGGRDGRSGVLVIRGEAGIGKTALLDEAVRQAAAAGVMVLRGTGIETEAELPFAGLHLLLRPLLDRLPALPVRQSSAVRRALFLAEPDPGSGSGPGPGSGSDGAGGDRFLVG